jgi:hypothetical protein
VSERVSERVSEQVSERLCGGARERGAGGAGESEDPGLALSLSCHVSRMRHLHSN